MTRFYPIIFFLLLTVSASAQHTFEVDPYLQYATQSSIRVHWETKTKAQSFVLYGPALHNSGNAILSEKSPDIGRDNMHYAILENLQPESVYFYQAMSVLPNGDTIKSAVNTFKTAVKDSSAFAFAVFSDSQNNWQNPEAWKRISESAFKERPDFAVHAGDLVDLGYMKDDWVNEFLRQGNAFMKTVPIFSIPGNHEHDAGYYYQYMYVPQPYFYSFKYGNAEFFMIDTDQYQEEGTDMFNAIELALAKSTAYWKIVVHHHPPFSSDEDDFGNTNYEASTLGDDETHFLLSLYEKYGVDIVFYGHIHTYERSWPIREKKTVHENGVLYVNIGGAGGGLENPAPTRSWFTNKLRTVHHFGYVTVLDNVLNFQAIDEHGNVFDFFSLDKSRQDYAKNVTPAAPVVYSDRRLFTDTMHVTLLTGRKNDRVYYSVDGSVPDNSSTAYSGPILLKDDAVLKAVAYNHFGSGRVATYKFNKEKTYKAVKAKKLTRGLSYGYFTGKVSDEDDTFFDKVKFEKTGNISGLLPDSIKHIPQHWGAVFTGYIQVPQTGYYRFDGHADHRLRVHIHDKLIFDEKNREINYAGEIYLEKGFHPVKMEYYNSRQNRAFIELYYQGPGVERQAIPLSAWWR